MSTALFMNGGVLTHPELYRPLKRDVMSTVHSDAIWERVKGYTMTGEEVVRPLIAETERLIRDKVPGAMLECGVWRGGSMMAIALTLIELGELRKLYLYDTFSGLPLPDDRDGAQAIGSFHGGELAVGLGEVRINLHSTGYPDELVECVPGQVEQTLPLTVQSIGPLALLRLDTDWYSSTIVELELLWPLLSPGGVLIVDDYGDSWPGSVRAVDEYFGGPLNVREHSEIINHRVIHIVKP